MAIDIGLSEAAISQEVPRIDGYHQSWEEAEKILPTVSEGEHALALAHDVRLASKV